MYLLAWPSSCSRKRRCSKNSPRRSPNLLQKRAHTTMASFGICFSSTISSPSPEVSTRAILRCCQCNMWIRYSMPPLLQHSLRSNTWTHVSFSIPQWLPQMQVLPPISWLPIPAPGNLAMSPNLWPSFVHQHLQPWVAWMHYELQACRQWSLHPTC